MNDIRVYVVGTSGMIMAFDRDGKQIPELQGPFETMAEKVDAVVPMQQWHTVDYRHLNVHLG